MNKFTKLFSKSGWITLCAIAAFQFSGNHVNAQNSIPTPKEHFGFNIGDNYHLANFTQTEAYFKKLAATSDRIKLVDIGETEEGRRQYMIIASSPENLKNLDKYKEISQKMALAEMDEATARKLSKEGKAVVWIDGGLHSTETVAMQQLIEMAYLLSSRNDEETLNILDKAIVLLVHANPDGQELVSNWYMREPVPEKRVMGGTPTMYQKYIGHDNNRDFFMQNMKESKNIARQLFVEWIPQIMYNHHQTAPAGTVVAGAPYRDPFNYVFDPLLITGIEALGSAMNNRLNSENKPGYTSKGGAVFSTWYNGGLRTTTYFHNIVGLLTETIGGPNPFDIPVVPSRLLPSSDTPNPIIPQRWYFRQSIDYSVSMNYAVMNYAARHADEMLFNIYRMGRNSIEKGQKDTWGLSPNKVDKIEEEVAKNQNAADANSFRGSRATMDNINAVLQNPELRDARGYIIPSNQDDFPAAIKFLNALIRTGIIVQKATDDFSVNGKNYPAGSYIVKTAQAFRPHILDMFEPQDHPNDFAYPGGPPIPPYDAAGWTPAYLMHIEFDRLLEDFTGPFERLPFGETLNVPQVQIANSGHYTISPKSNDSFKIVNLLLSQGFDVYRNTQNGDFYLGSGSKVKSALDKINSEIGVNVVASSRKPGNLVKIKPSRIGLWDTYGGSMPSGWIRWIKEQYAYDFNLVFAQEIDKGNLNDKYDVLVFVGGAIPSVNQGSNFRGGSANMPANLPEEFRHMWGRMSVENSIPALKEFLEKGGKIITIGSSANLAYHLNLPVTNALTERVDGEERPLPREKYYVPGSVLNAKVDTQNPATWGLKENIDLYFNNSPVFRITAEGVANNSIKPIIWFDSDSPLRSGWAWGQKYLEGGLTGFEAQVGSGKLVVFGPEITFRAQAQGTFKLLFNQLYL